MTKLQRVYIYLTYSDGTEVEKEIRSTPALNKLRDDTGLLGELIEEHE